MERPDSGSVSPGRYAPHLSEFYSIVNNTNPSNMDGVVNGERRGSHSMAAPSMASNFSSISDLRTLVTKKDIKNTVDALQGLLDSSRAYTSSLQEVSRNASLMGHSLENLSRLKGCNDDSAEKLLSASGLFYLLANHENIMSQCLKGTLGGNLLDKIDQFKIESKKMENEFKAHAREESLKLKMQERHNMKLAQRRTRNLVSYKESLVNLQSQLDQLESLRHDYYQDSYNLVESTCSKVLDAVATVSRARVEISENVARKGWSGGGLDDLLMDAEDPFNSEGSPMNEDHTEGEEPIEDGNIKKDITSPQVSNTQPQNEQEAEGEHDNDHDNEREEENFNEDDIDPDADNSFSLPLAGSSKSQEPPIEDNDES
ncbi:hypothetical protein ZYGM_004196 [Zygosaccharomyces mellis]|uniref:Uncharacterized protein n=1 Tax=Zygosaccharomyces mellis TaxID=42258 RepID=A0A4C2E254_9SACH|nr:hypothetical protein ZYGM_004196 [Zygosaccharomyces mellis]